MTDAILEITDGITRIDLINPSSGFHLIGWTPQITDYKGGGVFQNPPLADWRQLRAAKWDTAQERFELTLNGANPNGVAYLLQQLRQLLEKANQYWTTDWQNDPVWLVAKAACETETRYCLIVKGRLANDQNHYLQPFTGNKSTMENLPLLIERRAWLANAPGVGTDTGISNLETFDSVNFGTVDSAGVREPATALGEVFVSNRQSTQNFTHIFNFDAGTATFSANLLDTIPMTLFPASAAVNDIVYFGIESALTDSGPIVPPIIFDFSVPASATTSYVARWEYWNGASWAIASGSPIRLPTTTGISPVTFTAPPQDTTAINGVTAWWFRLRITSLTGTFTNPIQQNRNPYIANWSYFEVQSTAIKGDIPALARMLCLNENSENNANLNINNVMIGMRSVDRGSSFVSYLNASDEHNPTGITVTSSNIAANDNTATGNAVDWTSSGAGAVSIITFSFSNTLSTQYYGRFRLFIRAKQIGSFTDDLEVRAEIVNGLETVFTTEYKTLNIATVGSNWLTLDMGEIVIPGGKVLSSEQLSDLHIIIRANATTTGRQLQLADIALLPVDEFAMYLNNITSTSRMTDETYIDVDSIEYPYIRTNLRDFLNDEILAPWQTKANGPLIAQANSKIRYWFVFNIGDDETEMSQNFSIKLDTVNRYLSLRGEQ